MPATNTNYFRDQHCVPNLRGGTKEEVIEELIQTFVDSGALDEKEGARLLDDVLAREEEATTGIGKGVALPHARETDVTDDVLIAVGVHHEGVDFDALDGALVRVVFLIASSDPQEYLRVAGRIAKVARDDVEMRALPAQKTPARMRSFLEEAWASVRA